LCFLCVSLWFCFTKTKACSIHVWFLLSSGVCGLFAAGVGVDRLAVAQQGEIGVLQLEGLLLFSLKILWNQAMQMVGASSTWMWWVFLLWCVLLVVLELVVEALLIAGKQSAGDVVRVRENKLILFEHCLIFCRLIVECCAFSCLFSCSALQCLAFDSCS
jgi:hypothetical protein